MASAVGLLNLMFSSILFTGFGIRSSRTFLNSTAASLTIKATLTPT